MPSILDRDIRYLKGIGEKRAVAFSSQEIRTVRDLFFHFPRRYEDRSKITLIRDIKLGVEGKNTVLVTVHQNHVIRTRFKRHILKTVFTDGTGYLVANFFNSQQVAYFPKIFVKDARFFLSGKVSYDARYAELRIANFELEAADPDDSSDPVHAGRIVPIYPEFENITSRFIRSVIFREMPSCLAEGFEEIMPQALLKAVKLKSLKEAMRLAHFPEKLQDAESARKRLAFDRLFFLQMHLQIRKREVHKTEKKISYPDTTLPDRLMSCLPFKLTTAQKRVLDEIIKDLTSPHPMSRLLQGDVGSGKTIVALISMLRAVSNGYQSALMAPTEILADQHYATINSFLEPVGLRAELLSGRMPRKERDNIIEKLGSGSCRLVVGTHALIQDDVRFADLSLAVIDEQHRFGVDQRRKLIEKKHGGPADMLIMTATPIPRTLSLTLYGDLDLSIIDELPPGRKPVITKWYRQKQAPKLYEFLKEQVAKGEKVYFIYPLVEESEKLDLKDAIRMYEYFKESVFPDKGVGLVHGRMDKKEKDGNMRNFKEGRIQVLVATTVVEVGVDVPDATIIVVEHAERFGLAQLHQLRGRIGRGEKQSTCLLVTSDNVSEDAVLRMKAMKETTDGFKIAEKDLEIRGPGELFGTRQSGMPDLRPADILKDTDILDLAARTVGELLDKKIPVTIKEREKLWDAYKQEVKNKYRYLKAG
jgi:ATP-dependent DNA helicase RecG